MLTFHEHNNFGFFSISGKKENLFYKLCFRFFLFLFHYIPCILALISRSPTPIPRIPTLIPCIPTPIPWIPTLIFCISTLIPYIPTLIPRIPTLIPRVPALIPRIPTLIPRVPIIPLIPFPDSPFRLLQIAS